MNKLTIHLGFLLLLFFGLQSVSQSQSFYDLELPPGAYGVQWFTDLDLTGFTSIPGATATTHTATTAGTYFATFGLGSCNNASMYFVLVDGIDHYSFPLALQAAAGADSYQWYDENGIIAGATSETYTANAEGEYWAKIKKGNCLSETPHFFIKKAIPLDALADTIKGFITCENTELEICLPLTNPPVDVNLSQVQVLTGSGATYTDAIPQDLCFDYNPAPGFSGFDTLQVIVCHNQYVSICDTAILIIEVSPSITISPGPDAEICETTPAYTLSAATAENYTGLLWTTDGTGTFDDATALNPVYTPSASDIQDGQIELILTADGIGACSDVSDFMILTIWQQSVASYAGIDTAICEGQSYMIPDAMATSYVDIIWSTDGDGSFNDLHILAPVYTPGTNDIATGNVTLSLTATSAGNCADSVDNMVLNIYSPPTSFAGTDAALCETDTYILSDAAAGNYSTLEWSTNGTGLFNDKTLLNTEYTPSANDILDSYVVLTLTVNGKGSCAETTDEIVLTIDVLPDVYAGYDEEICEGETFTAGQTAVFDYTTLLWSTNGDGTFDDTTALMPEYTPGTGDIAAGSVVLTLTAGGFGDCMEISDDITLTITSLAIADAGADTSVCETEGSYTLSATASGYNSLLWSTSGTGIFDEATALNPVYNPSNSDIFDGFVILTLTAKGNSPCGDAVSTMTLTIHPVPTVDAGIAGTVCYGEDFQVSGATTENHTTFEWTTHGDGIFDDSTMLNPVYIPGTQDMLTGYAKLILTAQGLGSCEESSDTVMVTVNQIPLADAGTDQTIPTGTGTILMGTATGGTGDYSYFWTPTDYIINPHAQSPLTMSLDVNTIFVLTVTDMQTGCTDNDTVMVKMDITNNPPVAVDDYDTTYQDVQIVINIPDNDYDDDDDELQLPELCGGPYNGIAIINSDGTLTYTPYDGFTGDDSLCYYVCDNGIPSLCDSAMVFIHVLPIGDQLIIYNGITPNGDGDNEYWVIQGIEKYPDNEVFLFNRWGNIFREYSGYDNETVFWDGTNNNGDKMPDGTYYYVLKVHHDGQTDEYTGWIYVHGTNNNVKR